MIPLAHWLSMDNPAVAVDGVGFVSEFMSELNEGTVEAPGSTGQWAVHAAYERGRADERAEAEVQLQQVLAEERRSFAGCQSEAAAKWSGRCGQAVMDSIAAAVARLQAEIEQAVADSLQPFLAGRAQEAATASLQAMIGEVLADPDARILEIRAPLEMHAGLSGLLETRKMVAAISVSDTIEVVTHRANLRFADMAKAWIAALRSEPQ